MDLFKVQRAPAASPRFYGVCASIRAPLCQRAGVCPTLRRCAGTRRVSVAAATMEAAAPALESLDAAPAPRRLPRVVDSDFLVLGSGIAGLSYALAAAEHGRVAVVTKAAVDDGCTRFAQGGICAVLDPLDSVAAHVRDTMIAGAWLNDRAAVEAVCAEGPALVLGLAAAGARFTAGDRAGASSGLHLTREGGHSARRIVHAADATGAEIERALVAAARAHPRIAIHEHCLASELVTAGAGLPGEAKACLGADVLDATTLAPTRFLAPVVMLATGGAGQVYPLTTNPDVATGDGMALAARAGAALDCMEFVQFHPTALVASAIGSASNGGASFDARPLSSDAPRQTFLISEAVRGEGGRLLNTRGERFMARHDASRMELAPRDIVARAIRAEMDATGSDHVLLDVTHLGRAEIESHFPTIAARCAALGLDIASQPMPVAPAQHYFCGGVRADLAARTTVPGLFAAGEVACSGLHGANRLASNSLLEGLVFGARAVHPGTRRVEAALAATGFAVELERLRAQALCDDAGGLVGGEPRAGGFVGRENGKPADGPNTCAVAARDAAANVARTELRELMWSSAGIVRSVAGMRDGLERVSTLRAGADAAAASRVGPPTRAELELRSLATVGEAVLSGALARRVSIGGHYCVDYPVAMPGEPTLRRGAGVPAPKPKRRTSMAPLLAPLHMHVLEKAGAGRGELARRKSANSDDA